MNKQTILKAFSTVVIAGLLTSSVAFAADMDTVEGMEKCMVNKDGKTMIKADKVDGGMGTNAWVWVAKGDCDKINKGDWTGVSEEVKAKFDWDVMKKHTSMMGK